MNKNLIILLAVCLVSAHAFVKRDAETKPESDALNDFNDQVKKLTDAAKEAFSSENFKKQIDNISTSLNNLVEDGKKFLAENQPKKE